MYLKNETDETLVMLTLAGEQRAYEVLVRRYQKSVIASAISVTKRQFMAEDAAQDAFVTAWMKLNTLQEPQKYGSWVCRIAKNCALNMLKRYRSFLPLEVVENINLQSEQTQNPAELYALSEEKEEIGKSIERLPEKVKQIIHLHYFEGLSIADIADRMRISEGTVKSQLHDGRKRIRKELCAMNEKYSDTLVERVMKKVEELKLWKLKNDKSGFEKVYNDVLKEVEDLPECTKKQHALADVLMRGWWWLPGEKNDALFARIANAAIEGRNEEVMSFIVAREDLEVYGGGKIEFIREKQIPRLEKAGFVKTLGKEWFWLGYHLFRENKPEEGKAAYKKAEEILNKNDFHRLLVPYALKMEDRLATKYKNGTPTRYAVGANVEEYRYINKELHFWDSEACGEGYMQSVDADVKHIFINASCCDSKFFADISLGETFTGSDGTTLLYLSDSETVNTPAGCFENCCLWVIKRWYDGGKSVYKTYYKEGIGIVKQEHTCDGVSEAVILKAFDIKGGKGLLPLAKGNRWEYDRENNGSGVEYELSFTVEYADEEKVIISNWHDINRVEYDNNSWLEMISQIRNDYWKEENGKELICDVSPSISRAEKLAKTKTEKAHTKAAASVARRIMSTNPTFNPDHTAAGYWNFFSRNAVQKKKDTLNLCSNFRWSFEWKEYSGTVPEEPILHNDILMILQDNANCIWSEEWRIGASPAVELHSYGNNNIKTQLTCEDGGTITTKAGVFENCLKLCIDTEGMADGWSYRGGKRNYYFAEGIGIVRTEAEIFDGASTAVYDLTYYEGKGEGFMPMADGLVRRYDAIGLTDGFKAWAEYTYVADDDGDIIIFSDKAGIRELPPPVTQYSAIFGEIKEDEIWQTGDWKAGHAKYAENNLHLMLHVLSRPSRNAWDAKRSVELMSLYMGIIEDFGENGEVPPAWCGLYSWMALVKAAASFGDNNREEGYRNIEIAIESCKKTIGLKSGDLLDTGKRGIFGGIKLIYNRDAMFLPDGTKIPVAYSHRLSFNMDRLFHVLSATYGWEWFNSARNEERYKSYLQQAMNLCENI
ncbi:MAG: RNA polymerase sigma factor [Ruminococcaceae bacterium]|nr:RNA polymerase sigma factor [Oscillospiraceae bacterium]